MRNKSTVVASVVSTKSISLDLEDVDLAKLPTLKGTALEAVINEIREEDDLPCFSKHHSHHSYRTHGTAAW